MALGTTHFRWRTDVARVVAAIESEFPQLRANTYDDHPWDGWDGRSIDVWGSGGRGSPISLRAGYRVREFVRKIPGEPWIRHDIYLQTLWTSWGGASRWPSFDHSGRLRHYHVTFW